MKILIAIIVTFKNYSNVKGLVFR